MMTFYAPEVFPQKQKLKTCTAIFDLHHFYIP